MDLQTWRQLPQKPVDRAQLCDILKNKMRLKREPVVVTYCEPAPPAGYEPVDIPVCAIVHRAEQGQKVYVNAAHHDCYVGQYHVGLMTAQEAGPLICDGEYLAMEQGFFTPASAKRNKQNSYNLPAGMICAIAAAPLKDTPADAPMDLLIVITDPLRAMQLAGAAAVREGTPPRGELGPSSCSSIFAAPWHTQNTVFALGEGGGRRFNAMDASEMFVVLPACHIPYVIEMFENFWFKPDVAHHLLMPSYARK
jgi:uncharacterized protein (DUF169 family)